MRRAIKSPSVAGGGTAGGEKIITPTIAKRRDGGKTLPQNSAPLQSGQSLTIHSLTGCAKIPITCGGE
ncbi:MAG: hypothetical protein O7D91_15970 [Planctomycetota bacterium]|nr:hypothetical protein [Planctomycetota bacterium]